LFAPSVRVPFSSAIGRKLRQYRRPFRGAV
jgi:hypothetical protein